MRSFLVDCSPLPSLSINPYLLLYPQTSNMDPIFIQVDVHFHGIFATYPISYTRGINQRLLDIDFTGMDKNGCYEFIERFTGEKYEKLYYCNIQEWLEEHKEEFVDNIVEEVIDGVGLIKEIETCHLDEDEDDHGAEDVDVDDDEDGHSNLEFFKKDNGPDVDMGEKETLVDPLEEAKDDNENV
ncbi:unnamed protein product [Lactuca saligna]|uniref:Uncharacterized protein n=1 Tax=Lactuca saligna TaxID=75948 RepID=A0AA35ZSG6_LACSI|nr:unnamed protein product [Lactuca saligna]